MAIYINVADAEITEKKPEQSQLVQASERIKNKEGESE